MSKISRPGQGKPSKISRPGQGKPMSLENKRGTLMNLVRKKVQFTREAMHYEHWDHYRGVVDELPKGKTYATLNEAEIDHLLEIITPQMKNQKAYKDEVRMDAMLVVLNDTIAELYKTGHEDLSWMIEDMIQIIENSSAKDLEAILAAHLDFEFFRIITDSQENQWNDYDIRDNVLKIYNLFMMGVVRDLGKEIEDERLSEGLSMYGSLAEQYRYQFDTRIPVVAKELVSIKEGIFDFGGEFNSASEYVFHTLEQSGQYAGVKVELIKTNLWEEMETLVDYGMMLGGNALALEDSGDYEMRYLELTDRLGIAEAHLQVFRDNEQSHRWGLESSAIRDNFKYVKEMLNRAERLVNPDGQRTGKPGRPRVKRDAYRLRSKLPH